MPEAATTPAGAAAPPASGGTSTLLDDLESQLGPGAADAGGDDGTAGGDSGGGEGAPAGAGAAAKPAAGAPAGQQAPPAVQQAAKPPAGKQAPAAKPAAKPAGDPNKDKDPVALRKRLAEVETELNNVKGNSTQQTAQLQGKLDELSKKRYWTPEDEQRNKAIQDRLQQVEASFFARDYAESPEFKDKFEKPWQKKHTEIIEDVKGMTIKIKGADGEDTTRAAMPADWFKVLNAPTAADARRIAKETFGEDAADVLAHRSTLKTMEQAGQDAIAEKRTGFDTERKTAFENFQRTSAAFQHQRESFTQALVQKYPTFFGEEGASDEEKAALKTGMEFVQSSLSQQGTLAPEDHAKRAAVMALYAGAFPRLVVQNKSLTTKVAELEAKLAKVLGTDPGNAGEGGGAGGGGQSSSPGGTAGLMAAFDAIPKE